MSEVTLIAETGRPTGTRPSRRMRAEGRVPGVIYGGGQPATTVTFKRSDLRTALSTGAGTNALVSISVDGDTFLTVVREMQRHPVRRDVTHVDFLKIDPNKPIEMDIPIRLVGEAKQVTVNGGMTEQRLNSLRVRVRPDDIPDAIEVDISGMTLDKSLLVKDLVLPEGTTSLSKAQQAVVTAELTRAAVTTKSDDDAEGEEAPAE
jgi:large subunit ribosomal protein L25